MNLEAIALRRAEEQESGGSWRILDKTERRRPTPRLPGLALVPLMCECGKCQRCKNRERMREVRAGRLGKPETCPECGRAMYRKSKAAHHGWCAKCRAARPAAYRRFLAECRFTDGGGI